MQLKEIISVPGMSGLYKVIASNKNGFIIESLQDNKRTMINSTQRIMTLSDISVYTKDGEVPLRDIFKKIQEAGVKEQVDLKSDADKLRDYFKTLVPEYDEERVYTSDIKKMMTWFEVLKDKIDFTKEEVVEEGEDGKPITPVENEKHIQKIHEAHGPKTENAKTTTARTRKKV